MRGEITTASLLAETHTNSTEIHKLRLTLYRSKELLHTDEGLDLLTDNLPVARNNMSTYPFLVPLGGFNPANECKRIDTRTYAAKKQHRFVVDLARHGSQF